MDSKHSPPDVIAVSPEWFGDKEATYYYKPDSLKEAQRKQREKSQEFARLIIEGQTEDIPPWRK